jgi:hypothetical protein
MLYLASLSPPELRVKNMGAGLPEPGRVSGLTLPLALA